MNDIFSTLPSTPPDSWQRFGHINWKPSDISPNLYQAQIAVSDEISLCVEAGGNPNNPPLIFVAGFGSQMMFWPEGLLKQLMDAGFFVVRFDNRDTGLSTKIHSEKMLSRGKIFSMIAKNQIGIGNKKTEVPYTLHDMANDVLGLIDALGFDKVNLIGASMGGMISQIICATHPDKVDKLILIFSSSNRAFLRLPKPKQFSTFFRRPPSYSERDMVRHAVWFMTAVGSPGHLDIKGTRAVAHKRYQRDFHPQGMAQQMNAILATGSLLDYTKQIITPTLIIHGDKDGLIHKSHGKQLANSIKNSRFVAVEGMGHDLPVYYYPYLVGLISEHCLTQ